MSKGDHRNTRSPGLYDSNDSVQVIEYDYISHVNAGFYRALKVEITSNT